MPSSGPSRWVQSSPCTMAYQYALSHPGICDRRKKGDGRRQGRETRRRVGARRSSRGDILKIAATGAEGWGRGGASRVGRTSANSTCPVTMTVKKLACSFAIFPCASPLRVSALCSHEAPLPPRKAPASAPAVARELPRHRARSTGSTRAARAVRARGSNARFSTRRDPRALARFELCGVGAPRRGGNRRLARFRPTFQTAAWRRDCPGGEFETFFVAAFFTTTRARTVFARFFRTRCGTASKQLPDAVPSAAADETSERGLGR